MAYQALYRKYRPATFDEVKGQEQVVKPLRNQVISGKIGHAFMFCGTRGTGKTSVAKIFAKAVNCEHPVDGNPCGECKSCRAIERGASMNVIEIDAASNNGVDNIREIREETAYPPAEGKYKVYIIDECHMLSAGAENALLKTLEEPPSYVIFILATTDPQKVAVTIKSRCQRYNFRRLTTDQITERIGELLKMEKVTAEDRAVSFIARKADGGMRDALSLTDQCISFYPGEELTYDRVLNVIGAVDAQEMSDFLRKIIREDVSGVFGMLDEMLQSGRDVTQIVNDLLWYLRNLMLLKASEENASVIDVSEDNLKLLKEEAEMTGEDTVIRYIRILSDLANRMRGSSNRRIMTETALVRMMRPETDTDMDSVLDRLSRIEHQMKSGMVMARAAGDREDGAAVQNRAQGDGEEKPGAAEPVREYERAAPADLQQIRAQWASIAESVSSPLFRTQLKNAEPKFDTREGGDGKIYVVFNSFIGDRYADRPELVQELENIIAEKTGHSIQVIMKKHSDTESSEPFIRSIRVDEAVSAMKIPVEEENDDDSEF